VTDFQSLRSGSDVSDVSARKQTGQILVPKTVEMIYSENFIAEDKYLKLFAKL
jgi:hypothetical protein